MVFHTMEKIIAYTTYVKIVFLIIILSKLKSTIITVCV